MEYCILSQCWFILYYFLRPLGIYPCKRTGSAGLEPTSATNFWSRLIFTIFIIGLINGATYSYIYLEESSAQSISFELLLTVMTITDILGIAALVIPSVTKFIFCLFKLRSLSKDLAEIQNDCNENSIILNKKNYNINEKMGKSMKTVLIWYGIKFVLCQISLTFLLLGSAYKFQEIFNWSDIGKLDVQSFFNFWILFYYCFSFKKDF